MSVYYDDSRKTQEFGKHFQLKIYTFCTLCTETTEAHLFAQESSSTHRIGVQSCVSNSIPVETNSNPVHRTQILWKKVSVHGFRTYVRAIIIPEFPECS